MSLHRNNSCANYIAGVSRDEFCAELLSSPQLSALRSSLCLTQRESLILSSHIGQGTLLSLSAVLIPHCPDNACINLSFNVSLVGLFIVPARKYAAIIRHSLTHCFCSFGFISYLIHRKSPQC